MAEFTPDPQQKIAIEHEQGPMLVVAGAGTGKTTVLVERVVNLILSGHAGPNEILAVTYTRNAATELRRRVAERIGTLYAASLRASTFHAYCWDLLKRAGQEFSPITKEDLFVVLRRRIQDLPLKYYIKAQNLGLFLPALTTFFDRCEDELVSYERYAQYVEELKAGKHPLPRVLKSEEAELLKREEVIARCEEIAAVFKYATDLLGQRNLGTFGNLISRAVKALETDAARLNEERSRSKFILIDEFQDSNVAQIRLAKLLAGAEQNVFAVGDPDQAIYRFRGATTGAFDQFQRHFANVKLVTLERNRRSFGPVLRCAFEVIRRNPEMQGRERQALVSARDEREPKLKRPSVQLVITPVERFNNEAEADDVCRAVETTIGKCAGHDRRPCQWSDFAVLYRGHYNREELITELHRRGIPFAVRGMNVLETPEVRDALAAVRAITNAGDGVAVFRLASLPQFGIDVDQLRAILRASVEDVDMVSVLRKVEGEQHLLAALTKAQTLARGAGMRAEAVLEIARKQFELPDTAPLRGLTSFLSHWTRKPIAEEGTAEDFLEYLDYFVEARGCVSAEEDEEDAQPNKVQLMTAHGAKGLEFPHVFVIRATTGSFPTRYQEDLFEFPQALRDSLTSNEGDPKAVHEEEERRLFYVAMTRAKDTLALSAKKGRGQKDPSPPGFLRELLRAEKRIRCDFQQRDAEFRPDIAAAAGMVSAWSPMGEWMLLPAAREMDRISLSASRIESYDRCPLQFKIGVEWNIPTEPVPAMEFGNAVHTTLKGYYDAVKAGRPLTRAVFLQTFETALERMRFEEAHQKELYRQQGLAQLAKFYDLRNAEPTPEVVATEDVFTIEVEGTRVVGRIDRADRIDGELRIVDYKTGKAKTEEDADESLQLSIYALGALEKWNDLPARISFYNLENNREVCTRRTLDELEQTKAKIVDVADAIRTGKFEPKPGFHCKWCSYRELCPVKEEPYYGEAAKPVTVMH